MRTLALLALGAHAVLAGWTGAAHLDAAFVSAPLGRASGTVAMTARGPALQPREIVEVTVVVPVQKAGLLGRFLMTRYYVAEEFGKVAKDDVVLADGVPAGVTIYDDKGCRPIATLAPAYVALLDVEGTGKLRDGRVINVTKECGCGHSPCYRSVPSKARWGLGVGMRPLQPFRTISVDPQVIPLGSMVYVAELDGMTMPGKAPWGGFVHDGCVIAADVGGGIDGTQIDFFVGRHAYKVALDARKKMRHVTVYDGTVHCADSRHWVAPRIGT